MEAAERDRLLSDDGLYTDPATGPIVGREALIQKIQRSQAASPGVSFWNDQLTEYGDQALSEWTMYDADGAQVLQGASYTRIGLDRRLTQMFGFFALHRPMPSSFSPLVQ